MKMAEDMGAHMTINNVRGIEKARHVAEICKGWKMSDIVTQQDRCGIG